MRRHFFDNPRIEREGTKSILVVGYDETFDRSIVNLAKYYRSVATAGKINCTIKLLYRNKREKRVFAAHRRFVNEYGEFHIDTAELETSNGKDSAFHPIRDILVGTTLVSFQCAHSDVIDLPVLEHVFTQDERYDHVIVLSDLSMERESADTETLLTLLYLRAIAENARDGKYGEGRVSPFSITSEIQNMENVNLAYNEYVSDYIISWKLIASLQAQVAENRHLYKVLCDLLNPGGAEIQLENVTSHIDACALGDGCLVDFDRLSLHMRAYSDKSQLRILLGFVSMGDGSHTLCPPRDEDGRRLVFLRPEDMLVVIRTR